MSYCPRGTKIGSGHKSGKQFRDHGSYKPFCYENHWFGFWEDQENWKTYEHMIVSVIEREL